MTWLVASGYVLAAWLMALGLVTRVDPRLLERLAAPGAQRRPLLARFGRHLPLDRARAEIRGRLAVTGRPPEDADGAVGAMVALAAVGVVLGLSTWPSGAATAVGATGVLGVAGFRLPGILLARQAAGVRARASRGVPDLLDLVAASVTAGLSPRLALERAPEAVGGILGGELARVRGEVSLGVSWRAALRRAAARTGLPELRRLAITLERSERLGAPVATRLRDLAREVRAERRTRREERARRAPVVMLFPLVFLILPAFVLAAVVPALLVATRGIP